jgi:hypothetical protein
VSLYAITFRRRTFTAYDAAKSASDLTKIYRRFVRETGKPDALEVVRWTNPDDYVRDRGEIVIKRGLIGEVA